MCEELKWRNRDSGGSWSEPRIRSKQLEEHKALELQHLTAELEALDLRTAGVHPKVAREAERLQDEA